VHRESARALIGIVQPKDIRVVYQPIVDLRSGRLFASEALVRCQLEQFRDPMKLFRHANDTKCAGRLGRMIRDVAVPLCTGKRLFLNVDPNELSEPWLVRPDDPIFTFEHEIYLEITESVPFTHFDLCLDVLRDVRSRGRVHLVVDDLGAGYSNLNRIADLAPAVVKLDRELIIDLDRHPRRQQLVSSVVRLCTELGAQVVAEGIETREEYSAICDTGAHYGQGYLFARPAFPEPAVTWPPPPTVRVP
jgi:EAL domain-containing protein (putative c-di-GMP-specific phosphodiesterase class I)